LISFSFRWVIWNPQFYRNFVIVYGPLRQRSLITPIGARIPQSMEPYIKLMRFWIR
jgi:hypothetical protein